MSLRRRALFFAGLFVAVSCSDAGNPLGPDGPNREPDSPAEALQTLECALNVSRGTVQCGPEQPNTGDALASGEVIVGGQNVYVRLEAKDFQALTDTTDLVPDTVAWDVTVQNLIPQALGTEDGTTAQPQGVRVFFQQLPVGIPTGDAELLNPDGHFDWTAINQPYFQYQGLLEPNEVSEDKQWEFQHDPDVEIIHFKVYVWAYLQYENGWADITPKGDTIAPNGGTTQLTAVVRRKLGTTTPGHQGVTWSSSDTSVAKVSPSGLVTGYAAGTAEITATPTATNPAYAATSVTIVVNTATNFVPQTFDALSNVTINVPNPGVLDGSSDADGTLTVSPMSTADSILTNEGGVAWLQSNGALKYVSKAGFAGTDVIEFMVYDGHVHTPATATVEVAASNYWYVRAGGALGLADGRDQYPFTTLTAAQNAAGLGDSILVIDNGSQTLHGPLALEDGQAIIGQGIPASIVRTLNSQPVTILATGTQPELTSATGSTVTLAMNNTIRGVAISSTDGATGISSATPFGLLEMSHVFVQGVKGPAVVLSSGDLNATQSVTLSSDSSGAAGISLTNVNGTLITTGGAIEAATGTAFSVSGGSGTITYTGEITNSLGLAVSVTGRTGGTLTLSGNIVDESGNANDTGDGISVTGNSGGTIAFTGSNKTINTATDAAVTLNNNGGATITFGGGNLDITTTTGAGFTATNGGTVSVTGVSNSVSTGTGRAVDMDGMSTGAGGVTFASVAANGAPNGIRLDNLTGAGFQVQGGAITGATTGNAVELTSLSTTPVELVGLNITGTLGGNAGIMAANSDSLQAVSLTVNVSGGPALSLSGGVIRDTSGVAAATFTTLSSSGSANNGVILTNMGGNFVASGGSISNAAGTGFAVAGGTISATYNGGISQTANNAALVAVSGSHDNGSLIFNTGTLNATTGPGVQFTAALGTYTFSGPTTLGGGSGISVQGGSDGIITFGSNTSITNASGTALHVANGGAPANVNYGGTITTSGTGRPVHVDGVSGGSVLLSGNVSSTGLGIEVQSNTGGTIAFDGASKSLSTAVNAPGVTATGNTGANVRFAGGGLAIVTTGTGAGFTATGGGTIEVRGANNTISSQSGTALTLDGVASEATNGILFQTIGSTAGTPVNGIVLNNVTGRGLQVNGGTISVTTGAAVLLTTLNTLTQGVTLQGMTLSRSSGTGTVVSGSNFGTLSLASSAVSASGGPTALSLTTGSLSGTIASINASSVAAGTHAVSLTGVGGTYTVTGGTVNATTNGDALRVSGGNAVATWNNTLAAAAAGGRSVNVGSTTGGSHTFGNTVSAGNGSAGVSLTANAGSITMPGLTLGTGVARFAATPLTLQMGSGNVNLGAVSIFTTGAAATGLAMTSAAGSGTLTVASGTVDATAGSVAVNLAASSGTQPLSVSLTTVNAASGANGIVLTNASGTFAVVGTGSSGTGGTIQNTSGSGVRVTNASGVALNWMNLTNANTVDGGTSVGTCSNSNVSTCNAAVDLDNVTGVTLNRLTINGSEEQGVVGNSVTNFTMSNTTVQNAGDEAHEHGVLFTGLFGTSSITSSVLTGNRETNFRALNTNGTLTLTVTGSTFSNNSSAGGGDGFLFDAQGTANATVNVSGSTFTANGDDHFNVTGNNSAVVNVTFANNTLSGGHPTSVGQGIALRAAGTYAGTFTYDIDNNTINGAIPTAINVGFGSTSGAGLLRGRIRNNDVGTSGVNLSGSAQGSCILAEANGPGTGTHTTLITNNILRRCFDKGIDLLGSRDGSNNLNATVTGNNINELVDPSSRWAIRLESGSSLLNETGTVCADIANNTLNAATIGDEMSVRARSPVTLRFPGYTGGTTDTGALQSYLTGRNPAGGTAVATVSSGATYNNTVPAGSACPTPP